MKIAGKWLPKGYAYCKDNSSYSFEDMKLFFCTKLYIDARITWILIFDYLFLKSRLLNFVMFWQNIACMVTYMYFSGDIVFINSSLQIDYGYCSHTHKKTPTH